MDEYQKLPAEVQQFLEERGLEHTIKTVMTNRKEGIWLVEHDRLEPTNDDRAPIA